MSKFNKVFLIIFISSFVALAPFSSQSLTITNIPNSQDITITWDELNAIVDKRVKAGIDEAVAAAVKAEELKYIDIIRDKDLQIATLQADKAKLNIDIQNKDIIIYNLNQDIKDLNKKLITTNFTVGGITLVSGFAGGIVLGITIKR